MSSRSAQPVLTTRAHLLMVAAGLSIPLLLGGVLAAAQGMRPPQKSVTAAKAFKNIQVLKKLPANQLLPTMHMYTRSLGVDCGFCHVEGPNHTGFEKDTKPEKRTARKMILMTRDIDAHQKVVGGQVSCYTCHHGHAIPESQPPAGNGGAG